MFENGAKFATRRATLCTRVPNGAKFATGRAALCTRVRERSQVRHVPGGRATLPATREFEVNDFFINLKVFFINLEVVFSQETDLLRCIIAILAGHEHRHINEAEQLVLHAHLLHREVNDFFINLEVFFINLEVVFSQETDLVVLTDGLQVKNNATGTLAGILMEHCVLSYSAP